MRVRVTPRASRARLAAATDGSLRASVTAPATDGRANAALVDLVADALAVRKSEVRVVSGGRSREKLLELPDLARTRLERLTRRA